MKIAMIGVGAYSTALAMMLSKKENNTIMMWTENPELVEQSKHGNRILEKIFPELELPFNVNLTNSYEEALSDASLVFIAVAAKYVDDVCKGLKPYYDKNVPICIASKGIEESTGSFFKNSYSSSNVLFSLFILELS